MKNMGLFILAIALTLNCVSQTNVIYGSVYAFKDLALLNIQVSAKKSKAVVSTDSMGRFTIVCDNKDKLTFTGHGFQTVHKTIKGTDSLRIKMIFNQSPKNEEVAIGYGHVSKENLLNAISHSSQYNNDYCNYTDIFALIQAKFGGVQVASYGGTKQVVVRGIGSINGNVGAIYVVDGVVVSDISGIVPNQVKSIDILKDGIASIYGANGANGAVLITTINGK
jgi:TonB-dependent SusC/RagA subfamily outer membrane receptor